jgi:FkbM family methyltransferase
LRKGELELALAAAPGDVGRREAYLEELLRFASVRTGMTHAILPEFGHPLALRCGTADVIGLLRAVQEGVYGFAMRATPRRILVLGAHVGFGALSLARRFPAARILCVEPNAAAFRVLTHNTLPIQRIQAVCAAAWHGQTRLGVRTRVLGDWGMQLHDQMPDAERVVPAYSVGELLGMVGWDQVDMVVCDIQGAEAAVFADPGQRWLQTLDTLAIFLHEGGKAAFLEHARDCFDPAFYGQSGGGDLTVFERHVPFRAVRAPGPPELALIGCETELYPVGLQDTPQTTWGFFVFDGDCCQIHPNPPGERPARAIFPRDLAGQTRFTATYLHAARPSHPVVFSLIVVGEDGRDVFRDSRTVNGGERAEVDIALPGLTGRFHLILQTEMAAEAPQNYNAWAQFLSPRIG